VFIGIVLTMFVVSVTRTPQLSDEELRAAGVFLLPTPREIADFSLLGQQGYTFSNEALKGKWSFLFFGFTHCPDVCPTSMAAMGRAERGLYTDQEMADEGFQGVLVSVDPRRDTPPKLAAYAQAFSPRFLGLSAAADELAAFARQLNVAFVEVATEPVDPADEQGGYTVDHTGNIVIVNPRGHYHGFMKLPHKSETIRLTYQTLAAQF
tara:strand:- start:572 stop:1195 length:624 start_codon:yes stop_codon:yes gene_type:complete